MGDRDHASSPPLRVTEVRISLRDDDRLKAFASLTLNCSFVVRGLKVVWGQRGPFVAMPSRKRSDGTFQDIAHPINNEYRRYLEEVVLRAYWDALAEPNATVTAPIAPDPRSLEGRAARAMPRREERVGPPDAVRRPHRDEARREDSAA